MNNIGTSAFVSKTKYDTDKLDLEKKIPDTSGLAKKLDYDAKISEIESEIPSISGLVANAGLTAVENKIPNISSLVKKQIITQKSLKLERNLLIVMTTRISPLQNLIRLQQKFLMQDYHEQTY